MSYREREIKRCIKKLIDNNFFEAKGGGTYRRKKYPHILENDKWENNLYAGIRESVPHNFSWHSAKGDTVSSQVACLNHLFPIRQNRDAILKMINKIQIRGADNNFLEVLPIKQKDTKKDELYIDFEVSDPNNLLDENKGGVGRTQIDALVRAKDNNGKIWIIVFEWKYTESYTMPIDRSVEDGEKKDKVIEVEGLGKDRMARYNKLIQESLSLESLSEYKSSVYYHEPYYELMRQTLWAELITKRIKIVGKREKKGVLSDAQDYLHICVVPKANKALLDTGFDGGGNTMEETWRNYLTDDGSERFKIIDPEDLFEPLKVGGEDPDLVEHINYLKERYWDNEFAEYFKTVVDDTVGKLSSRESDLKVIYNRYAEVVWTRCHDDNYLNKGEEIKGVIKNCGGDSVLQLYNSKTRVEDSKYDVRLYGHHYCDAKVYISKKRTTILNIENEGVAIDSPQVGTFFTNFPLGTGNDELKLQALIRGEMDKKGSVLFKNIEPVKVGAGFFEMPTPLKASTHKPIISITERKGKNGKSSKYASGGTIDILARVSCPNGGWMPAVIEVKDENKPVEPVEDVMIQALIYATFLGHLLADKDCGEAWYNIIGGKGQNGKCPVPDTIDILVVAMMPPKKYGKSDKINETQKSFKVGDNDKKKTIILIPCTCYIDTDENFTTINDVKWSCFKKNG